MPDNDPISILTTDHNRVRDLFSRIEREQDKAELIDALADLIEQHTELEEDIFYPAFLEAAAESDQELMYYKSIESHDLVDTVLAELDPEQLDPPVLRAKMQVLQDLVLHHIEEEENQLFPLMRKLCSKEELSQLGDQIQARHDETEVSEVSEVSETGDGREQQIRGSEAGTRGTLNINQASIEQLRGLAGIDEVRASRIVEYRDSHGGFEEWQDLSQIEGFDEGMVRAISEQASIERPSRS